MSIPKTIIISTVPKYMDKIKSESKPIGMSTHAKNSILANSNILKSNNMYSNAAHLSCVGSIEKIQYNSALPFFASDCSNKKRKLEHLSLEEKLQRKKLKNRVAAQSSRDRKKAKMDELEAEVRELKEKNGLLTQQFRALECEKQQLAEENEELRQKLTSHSQAHSVGRSLSVAGPAVSVATDPLPQGQGLQLARGLDLDLLVWRILTLYLPSQICWETLKEMITWANSKHSQTACSGKLLKNWLENNKGVPKSQEDVRNLKTFIKWWGRHQKMWNPIKD